MILYILFCRPLPLSRALSFSQSLTLSLSTVHILQHERRRHSDVDVNRRNYTRKRKTIHERISIEELKNGFSELSQSLIEFSLMFVMRQAAVRPWRDSRRFH